MARRFMEVTETLGVLMMAGQPDWRHTDVGVVVVVTPNICKYLLSTILSLDLPAAPCLFSSPAWAASLVLRPPAASTTQKRLCLFTTTLTKRFMLLRPHLQLRKVVYHWALKVLAGTILRLSPPLILFHSCFSFESEMAFQKVPFLVCKSLEKRTGSQMTCLHFSSRMDPKLRNIHKFCLRGISIYP
jgi:hypothetical protein